MIDQRSKVERVLIMEMTYYFFGDTPQREIYNEANDRIHIEDSGALYVQNYYMGSDIKPKRSFIGRDNFLPLSLYKYSTSPILDDDEYRDLFAEEENSALRLENKELLKYPATVKQQMPEQENGESRVVLVWTEKDRFEGIPDQAILYIWVAVNELPDPDFMKSLQGEKIVITCGDVLRSKGAKISKCLSWEETALDTVWQYTQNSEIRDKLNYARMLIVAYGIEGAVVLNSGKSLESRWVNQLFFHQTKMEGDLLSRYPGFMPNSFELFVKEVFSHIVRDIDDLDLIDFARKMPQILSAQATMHICGYYHNPYLDLHLPDLMQKPVEYNYVPTTDFSCAEIPDHQTKWSIPPNIDMFNGNRSFLDNLERLKEIVEGGAVKANLNCPILRIGDLESVGRSEIESYSSIKNLIYKYVNAPFQGRPLSIAVFGQPGSGKSFGVKEIAKNILGRDASFLEFNLSQYEAALSSALFEAFHDVQDQTMNGKIPLVFFDEFDSHKLSWPKCFLMPMQDGEFLEHGRRRPLGKCIFVFAGGIFHSYAKLMEEINRNKETNNSSIENKIPDFLSRIRGYIDILGINPEAKDSDSKTTMSPSDQLYIIKRAMVLSSMLKRMERKTGSRLSLSDDVLFAFLYTKQFTHGARSMEAILEMSSLPQNGVLEINDLPSGSQLALHVDPADFNYYLRERIHRNELVGRLARKYAQLGQRQWDKILSQEQDYYYKRAEDLIYYVRNELNFRISLCGDTGKIQLEESEGVKRIPVLFFDREPYHKLDKEKLTYLISQSKFYLGSEGLVRIQPPDEPEARKEYLDSIQLEVMNSLRPFDVNPENTGFYLYEVVADK